MGLDLSKLSIENKQLALALVNAGRVDDAMKLISVSSGGGMDQRTGPRQYGSKEEMVMRGRELGMRDEDLFMPEEPWGNKFMADMGAGFVKQGLGAQQFAEHLMPGRDTSGIDERVRAERRKYEETGLADEFTGGQLASYIAPAVAGGVLSRGVMATAPLRTSMALGAIEELPQPVLGDDYWTQKGKDVAFGATVGGLTEGVPAGAIRGTEIVADQPGRLYRATQEPSRGEGAGWLRGDRAEIEANVALGQETGIDFTPGQVTQSGATQQVEELARTNLFTRNRVAQADQARAGQYDRYIQGFRDSLGQDAPIETVAPKVQAWGEERAGELINNRHIQANEDYLPVQQFADGQPIIPAENYARELQIIMRKGQGAGASEDQIRAAKQASQRWERLDAQGGQLSGADIEMLTRATDSKYSGSPFDLKDPDFNEVLAGRLSEAAMNDARKVPQLHDQLMTAKRNYAINSSHIEEFENGLVGQILGKKFMSEVDGVMANTKSPEFLFQKFRTGSPTQIEAAMKHMDSVNPELANDFRASFIERAREGAKYKSAAGGLGDEFDPATFLRNLGITSSGEKGLQGYERLLAMFPGQEEAITNLYRAGAILGDKTNVNTSKTDVSGAAREAMQIASSLITGSLRALGQTLGSFGGIQGIARSMELDRGYRRAPEPVNLGKTRRVWDIARTPAVLGGAIAEDVERP
jgi:hypothetical protein